jgi:hypothetical protein
MLKNDSFTENLVENPDCTPTLTNCMVVCQVKHEDVKVDEKKKHSIIGKSRPLSQIERPTRKLSIKVQHAIVDIVWILSFHVPIIIKTLKLNDAFIDDLLKLVNGPANKVKETAKILYGD